MVRSSKKICFLKPVVIIWHIIKLHLESQESKTNDSFCCKPLVLEINPGLLLMAFPMIKCVKINI